jgi:small subunit ribosomal protein S3
VSTDDKVLREAEMATGGTSGTGARPRRVISSGGTRRRPDGEAGAPTTPVTPPTGDDGGAEANAPIVKEADPELERLLAEEEDIERRTRDHHEAPHFRKDAD